jgi:hypothetical protein
MANQNDSTNTSTGAGNGGQNKDTSDDSTPQKIKGNSPSAGTPVGVMSLYVTAGFLIVFIALTLYGITTQWPVCELPEDNQNANTNTGANENRQASPAANINAPTPAVANVNASTNGNIAPPQTNRNAGNRATNTTASTSGPATASNSPSPSSPTNSLDADSLEPANGPITGKTLVTIKGKNFGSKTQGVTVKFGEREAQVNQVSDRLISVRTPMHSEGLVDVTVTKGAESDTLSSAYTYICPAPTGSGLFFMLIMAGALGGSIHALRSLYWYSGQGKLKSNWLPMYFSLPFIGSAMAMIFSLLIFAGFVDNTTGRSQALFIIAVAGLVGMFSQQAALKLTDVANAFFTKPGGGKDAEPQESLSVGQVESKAASLAVTAITPAEGAAAGNYEVKITGSGFNTSTTVSFGGVGATIKGFNATSMTVVAPPHKAEEVDVEVKSGDQLAKSPVKFKYK